MLSFNNFIEFKSIEVLIDETAKLFVELDIEPEQYIEGYLQEVGYTPAGQNFQQGYQQVGSGLAGGLKTSMGGLNQMGQAMGQGARDWWKRKMDPVNKINIAQQALARFAQSNLGNQPLPGGKNVSAVVTAINNQLTQLRNQMPDPVTGMPRVTLGQPRNGVPTGTPTPGPSI